MEAGGEEAPPQMAAGGEITCISEQASTVTLKVTHATRPNSGKVITVVVRGGPVSDTLATRRWLRIRYATQCCIELILLGGAAVSFFLGARGEHHQGVVRRMTEDRHRRPEHL